jgi:hypothetical protein
MDGKLVGVHGRLEMLGIALPTTWGKNGDTMVLLLVVVGINILSRPLSGQTTAPSPTSPHLPAASTHTPSPLRHPPLSLDPTPTTTHNHHTQCFLLKYGYGPLTPRTHWQLTAANPRCTLTRFRKECILMRETLHWFVIHINLTEYTPLRLYSN